MTRMWSIIAALLIGLAMSTQLYAADVKIGVIYPLTGNAASAGQSAKDAVELGAEIVNKGYPELKSMPVGGTAGLPNLAAPRSCSIRRITRATPRLASSRRCGLLPRTVWLPWSARIIPR